MNKTSTVTINDIKYVIKNKNDIIQGTLLRKIQWNNDVVLLIGHWIKKYNLKHFVNIGSHIGTVALPISKYIERVTAIEPFPPTYKHFLEHTKLNNISNIVSFNIALGDKKEKVYFLDYENKRIKNNTGGMHAVTKKDIKENRLSSILHSKKYSNIMKKFDDLSVSKFDIMLIDVEGREYEVLKGGSKKISQNKPIIIIEIWNNAKRKLENMSSTKEDVIKYTTSLNYRLLNKVNDDYIFFPESLKV